MRRVHLSLLIFTVLCMPLAVSAADDSRPAAQASLKQQAGTFGATVRKDAKSFGVAIRHTATSIGHAAKDFWGKVTAATRQGAHEFDAGSRS